VPDRALAATLDKTPYVDPDIEAERQVKMRALDVQLRVDKVQIGLFYRPEPTANRCFSVEWEASYTDKSIGWLYWEYEHKLIRIQIGDRMTEQTGSSIVIKFSNIRKLGAHYDFGNPCESRDS
jgi:RNA-dependent RNA polymerase